MGFLSLTEQEKSLLVLFMRSFSYLCFFYVPGSVTVSDP